MAKYLIIRQLAYFENHESLLMEQLRYMRLIDNTGELKTDLIKVDSIGEKECLLISPPAGVLKSKWFEMNISRSLSFGIRLEVITDSQLAMEKNIYQDKESTAYKGQKINIYA